MPFEFTGKMDDPEVYAMFKSMTTPGFQLDKESLEQPSITTIYPNDDSVFMAGNAITVQFSHLFQDTSVASRLALQVNDKEIPVDNNPKKVVWEPKAAGLYNVRMLVYDKEGKLLNQSAPVDIEISPLAK